MEGPRMVSIARCVGLWLAVLALAAPLVPWTHADDTDEVEWTAIAISHWQQVTRGGPPAGLEFEDERGREAGPWRSGVQRTLFGYPSSNLPKLVWGAALDLAGERTADGIVFDVFEQRDRVRGARAAAELERAEGIARGVTYAVWGLAGALLYLFARQLAPAGLGRACGALALVLWLATPAVRHSATFVRGDPFLLATTLLALLAALRARPALAGERGPRALWLSGAGLGCLCGLVVASKLNGVFVLPTLALWSTWVWWGSARAHPRAAAAAAGLFALGACATYLALHPHLWGDPLAGVADTLGRWRWMRDFLRTDWAPRARLVAPEGLVEGWNLFIQRLCVREDPWRVLLHLPLRPLFLPLALAASLWSRSRAVAAPQREALDLLVLTLVAFGLGTAAWLPIDWSRYWLSALVPVCVLEARLLAAALGRARARWSRSDPASSPAEPASDPAR
jgi:hypothetical protein